MRLKLYYLDDEPALLELFTECFASDNVEITTFADPVAFMKTMTDAPPDLVFLDYRLPNTNGDKIALTLDPNLPKALVTGDLTIKVEAKFEEVFKKPYRLDDVATFIEKHVSLKNARKRVA
jgi:DNA-binding NtrC family response regulator